MLDTTFICGDGITTDVDNKLHPYDPCGLELAKKINKKLEFITNLIGKRIETEKKTQQKKIKKSYKSKNTKNSCSNMGVYLSCFVINRFSNIQITNNQQIYH